VSPDPRLQRLQSIRGPQFEPKVPIIALICTIAMRWNDMITMDTVLAFQGVLIFSQNFAKVPLNAPTNPTMANIVASYDS
jgi:hypothetical protein